MIARHLTLISLIISTNALSIANVSEQNVTKRETNLRDLFPDWVPFKNKHGEELGEFFPVNKSKIQKRLAPPINFILRAVAEPEGDDYFEKGQGESDSDDYYEKKEWSDTNRPVESVDSQKPINHTEISDIDGVVSIITKRPINPVVEALRRAKQKADEEKVKDKEDTKPDENREIKSQLFKSIDKKREEPTRKYEDDVDYEESSGDKPKHEPTEEDQSESEAKKTSILDSVDELKERHAKEQVAISEKVKEEEIYREEREREKITARLSLDEDDKYNVKLKSKKAFPDYEEYEDKEVSLEEKYKLSPERTKPTTTRLPKRTSKRKGKKDKKIESGKLSVFKNPQLYMVYDDENDESTTEKLGTKTGKENSSKTDKFSAKYLSTSTANIDAKERISLVPEENEGKEGEPTLFFPKRRKNNKRKKTTIASDSKDEEPETNVKSKYTTTLPDATGSDSLIVTAETGPSASDMVPTNSDILPTNTDILPTNTDNLPTNTDILPTNTDIINSYADDTPTNTDGLPTNTDAVTDTVPAPTHHKEAEKADQDYHREKGGGRQHESEHEEEHSEEGKKAYEGVHKETKSSQGHHEKENHLGKYDDHGGVDKHHEEESGHYGDHHHEEHGKKHAKYEESGKHSKGHSTKGSHDIHKKEEYEKKVEFFEEEGDSGEKEKHGGFNEENAHSKGGNFKDAKYTSDHEEREKGDSGHFANGGHLHVSKGHKAAEGQDTHGKHGYGHLHKTGKEAGKKWIYHHGFPAKTANLVLIDRRAEQLYHGPQYYG